MRKILNINIEKPQYVLCQDISYAMTDYWFGHTARDLKMDIIYPEDKSKKYPCILWICGGAWLIMDKGAHIPYLSNLAQKGFVVASVQYRTSNEANFPEQLKEIKSAIRFLKAHANRFNIDASKIGVSGESAGGHLACLAALDHNKENDAGLFLEFDSSVQAACPWYPPTDFKTFPPLKTNPQMPGADLSSPESLLLGYNPIKFPELAEKANPVNLITKDAPPFLIIHGNNDHTVPFSQGELLYNDLEKNGTDVTLLELNNADHADIRFFQDEVWNYMAEFFHRVLG